MIQDCLFAEAAVRRMTVLYGRNRQGPNRNMEDDYGETWRISGRYAWQHE